MTIITGVLCALAVGVGRLGLRVAWLVGALLALGLSVAFAGSSADALIGALAALVSVGLALLNRHIERRHEDVHGDDQDY